jgi:nicotinate-nucleotide adenylyltransferase
VKRTSNVPPTLKLPPALKLRRTGARCTVNGIGLLGGTFNPIHCGHLKVASTARKALSLKKVIFIPSAHPPHKKEDNLPAPADRYKMAKLAIADNAFFLISNVELKRRGKSWTIDTVRFFKKLYPEYQIYFIVGADVVPEIPTWKNYKKLLKICKFVVVNRPGYIETGVRCQVSSVRTKIADYTKDFIKIKIPGIDISSTEIRKRIRNGKTINHFVPERVGKYIREKGLYL